MTAALAALAGKRQTREIEPAEPSERGFYRVAGRKLPPVLTSGGDGYSDPRGSAASGESDYYRGSQAFEPSQGITTRLALGSPMRPVSGVPIMRPGPGRTAVAADNPFSDPPSSPFGDGSGRGSGESSTRPFSSRFHEGL